MSEIKVHMANKQERINGLKKSVEGLKGNISSLDSRDANNIKKAVLLKNQITQYEEKIKELESEI